MPRKAWGLLLLAFSANSSSTLCCTAKEAVPVSVLAVGANGGKACGPATAAAIPRRRPAGVAGRARPRELRDTGGGEWRRAVVRVTRGEPPTPADNAGGASKPKWPSGVVRQWRPLTFLARRGVPIVSAGTWDLGERVSDGGESGTRVGIEARGDREPKRGAVPPATAGSHVFGAGAVGRRSRSLATTAWT